MTRAEMIAALERSHGYAMQMATACYNLAQQTRSLTDHDRKMLDALRSNWDATWEDRKAVLAALTAEGETPRPPDAESCAYCGTQPQCPPGECDQTIPPLPVATTGEAKTHLRVDVSREWCEQAAAAEALAGDPDITVGVDLICTCEGCQIKLPEHLGTYTPGMRGSIAWRCAVCLPIQGPSGRLLRDAVVAERRKRLSAALAESAPTGEMPRG